MGEQEPTKTKIASSMAKSVWFLCMNFVKNSLESLSFQAVVFHGIFILSVQIDDVEDWLLRLLTRFVELKKNISYY